MVSSTAPPERIRIVRTNEHSSMVAERVRERRANSGILVIGDPRREVFSIGEDLTNTFLLLSGPTRQMTNSTETRSILFLDVAGWSKLAAVEIADYVTKVLPELNKLLSDKGANFVNTWGDAIIATFPSARNCAECALDIRDFFSRNGRQKGVADGLSTRIALHVGEVILAHNPILNRTDIFGAAVHVAARLEPKATPGSVVSTKAFADALKEISGLGPKTYSLGQVVLPKDYGTIEAFLVLGTNEPVPR